MIKTDFEYETTNKKLSEFLVTSAEMNESAGLPPEKREILRTALLGEADGLRSQLEKYDRLKSGQIDWSVDDVTDLPEKLIEFRIARGTSQGELAEHIGVSEDTIVNMEDELYDGADRELVSKVIASLEISVPSTVNHFLSSGNRTLQLLDKTVGGVYHLLLPQELRHDFNEIEGYLKLHEAFKRVFRDQFEQVLLGQKLNLMPVAARYKMSQRAKLERVYLQSTYAAHIAEIVSKTIDACSELTTDPIGFRKNIIDEYGTFSFNSCLNYLWDLGVPVVPLQLKGGFDAACWRFANTNVIVLKQSSTSSAKWLFDLLHEYWHATQAPNMPQRDVVDIDTADENDNQEEQAANRFARDVIFNANAESLLQQCNVLAGGKMYKLKRVVEHVAITNDVDVGSLANLVAYEMSSRGRNWWGAAQNLQTHDDPYADVYAVFKDRINADRISDELDYELLWNAFQEQ